MLAAEKDYWVKRFSHLAKSKEPVGIILHGWSPSDVQIGKVEKFDQDTGIIEFMVMRSDAQNGHGKKLIFSLEKLLCLQDIVP